MDSGVRAVVLLREQRFNLITAVLGAGTDAARARLIDCDPKTLIRARRGVVGEVFIAKTLNVMQHREPELKTLGLTASFEEVFEVGERPVAS